MVPFSSFLLLNISLHIWVTGFVTDSVRSYLCVHVWVQAGGLTTSVSTGLQGLIKVTAWGGEEGTEWHTGSVDDIIDVTVHFGDENITRMDVTYELDGEIETNSYVLIRFMLYDHFQLIRSH